MRAESVEKIKGTVKNVNRVQYPDGPQVELTLETDDGDMKVLLGPAWYIDQNKVKVNSVIKFLSSVTQLAQMETESSWLLKSKKMALH